MKKKSTLFWIWKYMKGQRGLLTILSLSSMITASAYVVPALLSRRAINAALSASSFQAAMPALLEIGALLLLVILLQLALSALNTHLRMVISGRMEVSLRQDFFKTLLKKRYASISRLHSGEILNRFTSDVDIVVSGITDFIPEALSIFAKLAAGLIVVVAFSRSFALLSIGVGLLILGLVLLFRPLYKKMHKAVQEASGVSRSFAQECVENIVVVKTFSGRTNFLEKLGLHMEKLYRTKLRRSIFSNFAEKGISLIFTLVYYGTLLWGAASIANDTMDYGTLMAFLQIVSQIQTPFLNASGLVTQLYAAMASAERLMELEQFPEEEVSSVPSPSALYAEISGIGAESLAFRYDKEDILKNASFFLYKGSMTAITGISGTGKSTIFRLLLGLFPPAEGRLFAKTDEGDIPLDAGTRALFAYVPQGNLLLSGTIRDNIKFLNPAVSDAQMEEAARAACIDEFLSSLPHGFDTEIGERGSGLSEGQMQRIAVARALCSDAPILLLDECTSALDSATEEAMLRNISALKTKTVLFISHKNAAFSFCDTHLAVEDGKIRVVQ